MHKILTNTWVILAGAVVLAALVILAAGPGQAVEAGWWV